MKRSSVYEPQTALVLRHLRDKGPLTQLEALRLYSVGRLAARIRDLREAGWQIQTETIRAGNKKFGRYWLTSQVRYSSGGLFPEEDGESSHE
jgi:hypothetical protein